MSEDKPLPDPRKRPRERAEQGEELLADRMARAMAEERLEEFVEKEFKGNENASRLAEMMMQMTGMAPRVDEKPGREDPTRKKDAPEQKAPEKEKDAAAGEPQVDASLELGIQEEIARIAAENGVQVEWIISRALGLYIRDHRTTGRL